VTVVDATDPEPREVAARYADVALIRGTDPATERAVVAELRSRTREFGRDPGRLRILLSLPVELHHSADAVELAGRLARRYEQEGEVDGFHLRPVDVVRDVARIVDGTVPLLQHHGLLRNFYPGATLREHLGLGRPANRYARAAAPPGVPV
jgi:alkanesulfonate monooxygenase SsuD/methylene tetrahydromethanopterin reductase-like flavin-dependent oxidoreductase (luciferase family)